MNDFYGHRPPHIIDRFYWYFDGSIQEAKKAFRIMKNTMEERCSSPENYRGDLLDQVINDMTDKKAVTNDQSVYIVLGIWFATCASISSLVTLIFKFLSEYPSVVEELRVCKHKLIICSRFNCVKWIVFFYKPLWQRFIYMYQVEHEEIIKGRDKSSSSLTWDEYKSMKFTQQVISKISLIYVFIPS